MGEAKRRRDARQAAYAWGDAVPRPDCCPACGSRRIAYIPKGTKARGWESDCEYAGCADCKAVWEAFPPLYVEDPVCAEPCDNCAFRPGSPEQRDTAKWKALLDSLQPDQSYGMFTGRFYCHKHVPLDMQHGPGNFLFPKKPVVMDGKPMSNQDGSPVTTWDETRMRTCSGFLRMVWALNAKRKREQREEGVAHG